MNHFNRAFVFGVIEEIKEEDTQNKKPYLSLTVNCSYARHGNVKAFGRLWGKDAVAGFKKQFKKGSSVRLTGVLTQYEGKNNAVKTSFNFYKADPWDPAADQHSFRRATFILVGSVVSFQEGGPEAHLRLKVRTETKGQDKAEEHLFHLSVPADLSLDFTAEFPDGADVRIKGRLAQTEDEFGDVIIYTRPLVSEVSRAKEKAGEEVPF